MAELLVVERPKKRRIKVQRGETILLFEKDLTPKKKKPKVRKKG